MKHSQGDYEMNDDSRELIRYLKESIDRLADKFDDFLKDSAERDIKQKQLETTIGEHDTRIKNLEIPMDKKLQDNHPILYKILEIVVIVLVTAALIHFFPISVKLLTGLLG